MLSRRGARSLKVAIVVRHCGRGSSVEAVAVLFNGFVYGKRRVPANSQRCPVMQALRSGCERCVVSKSLRAQAAGIVRVPDGTTDVTEGQAHVVTVQAVVIVDHDVASNFQPAL